MRTFDTSCSPDQVREKQRTDRTKKEGDRVFEVRPLIVYNTGSLAAHVFRLRGRRQTSLWKEPQRAHVLAHLVSPAKMLQQGKEQTLLLGLP